MKVRISIRALLDQAQTWLKSIGSMFSAAFAEVDFSAGIDRVFRFLEMSAMATLINLVYSIIDYQAARYIGYGLTCMAGAYLAWPLVKMASIRGGHRPTWMLFSLLITFGMMLAICIAPLQTLVRATIQVDKDDARRGYAREIGRQASYACVRAHHWPPESCIIAGEKAEAELLTKLQRQGEPPAASPVR